MHVSRWAIAGVVAASLVGPGCFRLLGKSLNKAGITNTGPDIEIVVPDYADFVDESVPVTINHPTYKLRDAKASEALNQAIKEDVGEVVAMIKTIAADPSTAGIQFSGNVTYGMESPSYVGIIYQINMSYPNGAYLNFFQGFNYIISAGEVEKAGFSRLFTKPSEAEDMLSGMIANKITSDPSYDPSAGITPEAISTLLIQFSPILKNENMIGDGARVQIAFPGQVIGLPTPLRMEIPLYTLPSDIASEIHLQPTDFHCTYTGDITNTQCFPSRAACDVANESNQGSGCSTAREAYCYADGDAEESVYQCFMMEETCKKSESTSDASTRKEGCSKKGNADFQNLQFYH